MCGWRLHRGGATGGGEKLGDLIKEARKKTGDMKIAKVEIVQ